MSYFCCYKDKPSFMEERVTSVLQKKQLRNTPARRALLEIFLSKGYALSHGELEELTHDSFDRVTIYRTLKTFEESGHIHEVLDNQSRVKYSLCADDCESHHQHHDNHLHFKCDQCEHTYCLPETAAPQVSIPKTYQARQVQVLVTGLCEHCVDLAPDQEAGQ